MVRYILKLLTAIAIFFGALWLVPVAICQSTVISSDGLICTGSGASRVCTAPGTVVTGTTFNSTARGIDLLAAGAKCDSSGAAGNGTDDRAVIQSVLDKIASSGGGTLVVPTGKICRASNFVSYTASHLTITGGGTLFFDPPNDAYGWPAFGLGTGAAGTMYPAGLEIYTSGCALHSASNPRDITTGRSTSTVISDIRIYDVSFLGTGSYNHLQWNAHSESSGTNIGLMNQAISIWCADNIDIQRINISGFYSDGIEEWGDRYIINNNIKITNIGFNGIGSWLSSDAVVSGNDFTDLGQGIEVDSLRWTISGNTLTNVAMSGISAGSGASANVNADAMVIGNTLVRDPLVTVAGGYGIYASCNGWANPCVDNMNVGNNTLFGAWLYGINFDLGTAVVVHDNTMILTAPPPEVGTFFGNGIYSQGESGWANQNPVQVKNNTIVLTTTGYFAAMHLSDQLGVMSFIVGGNNVTSPGFNGEAGSPVNGYRLLGTGTPVCVQSDNYSNTGTITSGGCGTSGGGPIVTASLTLNGGTALTNNQGNGAYILHSTGGTATGRLWSADANGNAVNSGIASGLLTFPGNASLDNYPIYCGSSTFTTSTSGTDVSCSWVTNTSHCVLSWLGTPPATAVNLSYNRVAGTVTPLASAAVSGIALVDCSKN